MAGVFSVNTNAETAETLKRTQLLVDLAMHQSASPIPRPTDVEAIGALTDTEDRDSLLMRRIAQGESAALEELISIQGPMLARLIGRLTGWHGDSDDIFQEVWLTVWKQAGRYEDQGTLEAWLKRLTLNRVKNHFRTLSRIKRKIERLAEVLASVQRPEVLRFQSDEDKPLHAALRRLSESDRTLIALVYLEETPISEVAQIMDVKEATLHVRIHRARGRLKALIQQESELENG